MLETFEYTAVDAAGRRQRGTQAASTPAALTRSLQERGWVVLDVAHASRPAGTALGLRGGRRRAVLEVTRAVAALLEAGMPLARALRVAGNVAAGETAAALATVRGRVERGETLHAALAAHPDLFSPLYLGMVRAGERSGNLDGAFRRLTAQLEREEELRSRLVSASIYPLLLAAAGGAALLVLLVLVLPRFAELLEGTGAALPGSTAALLWLSEELRRWWPVLAALAAGALALVAAGVRTDAGRRAASRALLALPLAGTLRRQALGARFARLLGVLLGGGAPLLVALQDTRESLDDVLAREEAERVRARVREGAPLHEAISASGIFPPLLGQLVAVGEESGQLRDFLLKAAEIFEEGTERTLRRLVSLAEPAMIVVFGVLVAFVAYSLLQAVYGVNADAFR